MARKHSTQYDLTKDYGRSEIISGHTKAATEEVRHGEIAGFPWQFVIVIGVMVLSVLAITLKAVGVL
jgi:uncharacterized Rmd1/YagE family protein